MCNHVSFHILKCTKAFIALSTENGERPDVMIANSQAYRKYYCNLPIICFKHQDDDFKSFSYTIKSNDVKYTF